LFEHRGCRWLVDSGLCTFHECDLGQDATRHQT
jgi:hypothetical protein